MTALRRTMQISIWCAFFLLAPVEASRRIPAEKKDAVDEAERLLLRHRSLAEEEATNPTSPEDHLITSLPLLDESHTALYAGHLPASEDQSKKLFYWLVAPPEESRADKNTPLLIWLNGGPGCSSMEGFFLENGPLRFIKQEDNEWKLIANPHSWHLAPAWVLYVDQPVGTGLSFTTKGDYCKNDEEVNRDFVYFLEEFLLLYKHEFLARDSDSSLPYLSRPLYFSGESHAGHYIPSMIDFIIQRDSEVRIPISVQGAAIGNGWVDPFHQYAVATAAYSSGLINMSQKAMLDSMEDKCKTSLANGNLKSNICFDLLDTVRKQSFGQSATTQVLQYDVSKYEEKGRSLYPPGNTVVEAYLGSTQTPPEGEWKAEFQDVLKALHATESIQANQHYAGCTDPPWKALIHQDGLGVTVEVSNILQHPDKIRLLFYNGMNDLICNHVGNEITLQKLPWDKSEEWMMAERFAWHLQPNYPPAGYVQEHDNLIYLIIPNAGHLVPMDQPVVSLQMMKTFLYNGSFQTSPQLLDRMHPVEASC